jgi:hypothetical protein
MKDFISIPESVDDIPMSPEAFRVYFSVVRHVVEHESFPTVQQITEKCFGKQYALGKTHTRLALRELTKFGLVSGDFELENYVLVHQGVAV